MPTDTPPINGRNGALDLSWGSLRANARGPVAIYTLLFVALFGTLIYVNHQGFQRTNLILDQLLKGQEEQRVARMGSVSDLKGDHREILCILALPPEERRAAAIRGNVCAYLFERGAGRAEAFRAGPKSGDFR